MPEGDANGRSSGPNATTGISSPGAGAGVGTDDRKEGDGDRGKNRTDQGPTNGRKTPGASDSGATSEAPELTELVRRCLDLWQDHVSAMATDPELTDMLGAFFQLMGAAPWSGAGGTGGAGDFGGASPGSWPGASFFSAANGGAQAQGRDPEGTEAPTSPPPEEGGFPYTEAARAFSFESGNPAEALRPFLEAFTQDQGNSQGTSHGWQHHQNPDWTGQRDTDREPVTTGAASSGAAHDHRPDDLARLCDRLAALEERLSALETGTPPRSDRSGRDPEGGS